MNFFDLDPTASRNILDRAEMIGVKPDELEPGMFDNAGSALVSGLQSSYNRYKYSQFTDEDNKKAVLHTLEALKPDPKTTGSAGNLLFGIAEGLGFIGLEIADSPLKALSPPTLAMDVTKDYEAAQVELNIKEGMDRATAEKVAKTQSIFMGAGVVAPASMAGSLAFRAGTGAALNAGLGIPQRAMITHDLKAAGLNDMAQQYQPFALSSLLLDGTIGAVTGGLFGTRGAPNKKTKTIQPSDLDAVLTTEKSGQIEVSSLPGLPVDNAARDAHVANVNKALDALLMGDPVVVDHNILTADFVESPSAAQFRKDVSQAVSDHLDLPTLERNLAENQPRVEINVPGAILGKESSISINGEYHPVRWALVDAGSVEATMTKADNQFRDRTRAASEAQVNKIANEPDYNFLNASPMMDYGAPTLSANGLIVGGNGRFAGLSKSFDIGTSERYSAPLRKDLKNYGIDAAAAAGMKKPVLVRILESGVDIQRAALASNEGGGLRMSALEQAKVDSTRLGDISNLQVSENGQILSGPNHQIIRQWAGEMPANERGAIVDKSGRLSAEGTTRLRNAILHRAFGDSPTLERLIESTDPGARNVAAALIRSAPSIAGLKAAIESGQVHNIDISNDITAAVEVLSRLREEGTKVSDYLNQGELLGAELTPEARKILQFMDENIRSAKTMSEFINRFSERVQQAGNPNQESMFGGASVTDKLDNAFLWRKDGVDTPVQVVAFETKRGPNGEEMVRVLQDGQEHTIPRSELVANPDYQAASGAPSKGEILDAAIKDTGKTIEPTTAELPFDVAKAKEIKQLDKANQAKLTEMYDQAAQAKPEFDFVVEEVAALLGGRPILADLKSVKRATDKIVSDYKGDASRIKDLLRATIEVQTPEEVTAAINAIKQRLQVDSTGFRNLYDQGAEAIEGGYRDAKMNIEINGIKAELQVNLPEMLAAKEAAHPLYESVSEILRAVKDRGDIDPTPAEQAKLNKLMTKMEALYESAAADLTNRLNAASEMRTPLRNAEAASNGRGGDSSQAAQYGTGAPAPMDTGMSSTLKNRASLENFISNPFDQNIARNESVGNTATAIENSSINQILSERPDMTIPDNNGGEIKAVDALALADEKIAQAQRDSQGFDAAVSCALRG